MFSDGLQINLNHNVALWWIPWMFFGLFVFHLDSFFLDGIQFSRAWSWHWYDRTLEWKFICVGRNMNRIQLLIQTQEIITGIFSHVIWWPSSANSLQNFVVPWFDTFFFQYFIKLFCFRLKSTHHNFRNFVYACAMLTHSLYPPDNYRPIVQKEGGFNF